MKKHYNDPRFEVLAEDLADILTFSNPLEENENGDTEIGGDSIGM